MRSNLLFIKIVSVFAVAILFVGSAFAQGKGKGGGGGKHDGGGQRGGGKHEGGGKQDGGGKHDDGGQQRGGGNRGDGGWKQNVQRQQHDGMRQQQQQQRQVEQAQRQQMHQQRQQQHDVQRQQRDAMRQQQMEQQRQWQQQAQQQHQQRQHQQRLWQQQQHQQREWAQSQRDQQRQAQRQQQRVDVQPQQNWGHIRREQAFEAKRQRDLLKAQRHAERDASKYARKQQRFENDSYRGGDDGVYRSPGTTYQRDDRNYRPNVTPYYGDGGRESYRGDGYTPPVYRERYSAPQYPGYVAPQYPGSYGYNEYPNYTSRIFAYNDDYDRYYNGVENNAGSNWKQLLFRSVIAMFFSNGDNGGYYDQSPQYYSSLYDDDGYGTQYSSSPYYTFGYQPVSSYYEPASYYGYDQYANDGLGYQDTSFGSLPYGDMVALYSGGFEGELIQRALATGYNQGLLEGQAARRRGWGDQYYNDPYLYDQAMYDPYSSSIGECRRHFSEGYEMGYQDALSGRDEFELADGGGIDLVSMLIGSVLSLRG